MVTTLLSWTLLCAAVMPAPRVNGDGEAAAVVREAFGSSRDRVVSEQWEQRAFAALRDEGWMWARVRTELDVDAARGARMRIEAGPRARVASLQLRGIDDELGRAWRESAGLAVGMVLRPREWERRVRAGLRALGERGHPFASATVVHQQADSSTGDVDLTVLLRVGDPVSISAIHVSGARHTRPEVLARLSGLRPGDRVRESRLREARARLEARPELVEEVESVELTRRGAQEVDVHLHVRQPATTGRFAAAVGAVRGEDDRTRLSGSVDIALLDLFGTARRFEGRWTDDGGARRRLDLRFLEPAVFGSALDLGLELGQRHEDGAYDTFAAGVRAGLAAGATGTLGLSVGFDRTTFLGEEGRVRWRQRLGASSGLRWRRPSGTGGFGHVHSSVEAARVRDTRVEVGGVSSVEASVVQTIVEFEGAVGRALTPNVAWSTHLSWRSTETDALPLPRSELWAIGGATTVRGYEEERFLGERIGWGGAELILGPARGGQAYGFVDVGWVQGTVAADGRNLTRERWLHGFGLGVRSPTALGAIDLSLGFAEGLGLDTGKLHLVLARTF